MRIKNLFSLALMTGLSFGAFAQQELNPERLSPNYDELKKNSNNPSLFQQGIQSQMEEQAKIDNSLFKPSPLNNYRDDSPFANENNATRNSQGCFVPLDNSFTQIPRNDDGSYGPINLPFTFNLYGSSYNQVWINTNGNLTFNGGYYAYSSSGFPFFKAMVAPFWGDVDTRSGGAIYFKVTNSHMIVTWNNVRKYFHSGSGLTNTFQAIIGTNADTETGVGQNVCFRYGDMQWTTGQASGSQSGFGGIPATVGVNKGNSVNYVQIGRFNQNNTSYDGPGGSYDGVNYLDNSCTCFNVSNASNIPPTLTNLPSNNTLNLNCGETATLNLTAIAPEVNQTTTATISTSMCGVTSTVTPGTSANIQLSIAALPCNAGTNTITITATDNGTPAATTTQTITVNVANCCSLAASGVSSDVTCPGGSDGSIDLTASNATGAVSYLWSTGATTEDVSGLSAGTYSVTISDAAGCSDDATFVINDGVDVTAPSVVTQNVSVTLANGSASITASDVDNGSSDLCGIASMSLDNDTWTCGDIGTHTVTLTVTDVNGNSSTGTATVTVNGVIPTCSIASQPTSSVYTGGDPNKIYLGYGAQSTVLNLTPSGGNSFTYNWTGSNLSSTTAQDPTFSPTAAGVYTFTCVVTNDNGCETTCSITICVEDVRVYKKNGQIQNGKVYLCHSPNGNPNNTQTLSISVNAVAAHLSNHSNDALGTCGQTACGSSKGYDIDAGDMYTDETAAGEMELVVYPNPSRSQFGLMLESPVEGMIQIRVYTLQGQIVEEYKSESNMVNMEFGSDLATGIYMLDVVQGDYRKTVRIEKL